MKTKQTFALFGEKVVNEALNLVGILPRMGPDQTQTACTFPLVVRQNLKEKGFEYRAAFMVGDFVVNPAGFFAILSEETQNEAQYFQDAREKYLESYGRPAQKKTRDEADVLAVLLKKANRHASVRATAIIEADKKYAGNLIALGDKYGIGAEKVRDVLRAAKLPVSA